MTRPSDISEEVWEAAETAFDLMLCNCIEASGTTEQLRIDSIEPLARTILAAKAEAKAEGKAEQREADARYIDSVVNAFQAIPGPTAETRLITEGQMAVLNYIVAVIRKGGQ